MSYAGRLLVATPLIGDPHFEHGVVLILAHGPDGAFGVVLNRPSDTPVDAVAPEWVEHVSGPATVFIGGPVAADSVMAIGRPVEPEVGGSTLAGGVTTVDLGEPPPVGSKPWAELRLFAGSSGWAGGQLEDELREGAWWVAPLVDSEVLTSDPGSLWSTVLRRQPGTTAWFANCPLNPSSN